MLKMAKTNLRFEFYKSNGRGIATFRSSSMGIGDVHRSKQQRSISNA
jgi:hypothetical protein